MSDSQASESQSSISLTSHTCSVSAFNQSMPVYRHKVVLKGPQRVQSRPLWDKKVLEQLDSATWLEKLDQELINFDSQKLLADRLRQINNDIQSYNHALNEQHLHKLTIIFNRLWLSIRRQKICQPFEQVYSSTRIISRIIIRQKMQKALYQNNYAGIWLQLIVGLQTKIFTFMKKASKGNRFIESEKYLTFLTASNDNLRLFMQSQQVFWVLQRSLICNYTFQIRSLLLEKIFEVVKRCKSQGVYYRKVCLLRFSKLLFRIFKTERIQIKQKISRIFGVVGYQSRFKALFINSGLLQYYLSLVEDHEELSRAWEIFSDLISIVKSQSDQITQRDKSLQAMFVEKGGNRTALKFFDLSRKISSDLNSLLECLMKR